MSTTWLITGANRGVGRALTASLLLRPHTTVAALVRDPNNATSQSLATLPKAEDSRVITTKYDAFDSQAAVTAVADLKGSYNITSLDVVIANAGFLDYSGPAIAAPAETLVSHFTGNALSQVLLFQATVDLLRGSTASAPKFIAISSQIGSISSMYTAQRGGGIAYGMSKAAVNYAVVVLSVEHPEIIVNALTPGRVMTEFGGPEVMKSVPAAVSMEDSVAGMLKFIDEAQKEKTGKFFDWSGKEMAW